MKDLRVQPYDPQGDPESLPVSVQAVMALRYGLFPMGPALFRFSGDREFVRGLRAARRALDTAFKVEKTESRTTTVVRRNGCKILMDTAHHGALTAALEQAFQQGIPSNLIDGMDCASEWLKGAMEVDPNKPAKAARNRPAKAKGGKKK